MLAEVAEMLNNHARGDVSHKAAELLEGLTGTKSGMDELIAGAEVIVPSLVGTLIVATMSLQQAREDTSDQEKFMIDELQKAAKCCAGALVNLSQNKEVGPMLVKAGAMAACVRLLSREEARYELQERLVLLLTNLTTEDSACRKLVDMGEEALLLLVNRYLDTRNARQNDDTVEHLGSVFMNLTRVSEGRKAMTSDTVDAPRRLMPLLDSPNVIRRRGVAAMLKNICLEFDKDTPDPQEDAKQAIHALLHESVLNTILIKLGSDKPIHIADEDDSVRILLSDVILLLVQNEAGLEALWKLNVAPKLQMCFQHEENLEISSTYEHAADFILAAGKESTSTAAVE